jgi:hypothetical protein
MPSTTLQLAISMHLVRNLDQPTVIHVVHFHKTVINCCRSVFEVSEAMVHMVKSNPKRIEAVFYPVAIDSKRSR